MTTTSWWKCPKSTTTVPWKPALHFFCMLSCPSSHNRVEWREALKTLFAAAHPAFRPDESLPVCVSPPSVCLVSDCMSWNAKCSLFFVTVWCCSSLHYFLTASMSAWCSGCKVAPARVFSFTFINVKRKCLFFFCLFFYQNQREIQSEFRIIIWHNRADTNRRKAWTQFSLRLHFMVVLFIRQALDPYKGDSAAVGCEVVWPSSPPGFPVCGVPALSMCGCFPWSHWVVGATT